MFRKLQQLVESASFLDNTYLKNNLEYADDNHQLSIQFADQEEKKCDVEIEENSDRKYILSELSRMKKHYHSMLFRKSFDCSEREINEIISVIDQHIQNYESSLDNLIELSARDKKAFDEFTTQLNEKIELAIGEGWMAPIPKKTTRTTSNRLNDNGAKEDSEEDQERLMCLIEQIKQYKQKIEDFAALISAPLDRFPYEDLSVLQDTLVDHLGRLPKQFIKGGQTEFVDFKAVEAQLVKVQENFKLSVKTYKDNKAENDISTKKILAMVAEIKTDIDNEIKDRKFCPELFVDELNDLKIHLRNVKSTLNQVNLYTETINYQQSIDQLTLKKMEIIHNIDTRVIDSLFQEMSNLLAQTLLVPDKSACQISNRIFLSQGFKFKPASEKTALEKKSPVVIEEKMSASDSLSTATCFLYYQPKSEANEKKNQPQSNPKKALTPDVLMVQLLDELQRKLIILACRRTPSHAPVFSKILERQFLKHQYANMLSLVEYVKSLGVESNERGFFERLGAWWVSGSSEEILRRWDYDHFYATLLDQMSELLKKLIVGPKFFTNIESSPTIESMNI